MVASPTIMEPPRLPDRRHAPTRNRTLQQAKALIAERIRRVCAAMEESEFDGLVTRIAEIDIKYRLRQDDSVILAKPQTPEAS